MTNSPNEKAGELDLDAIEARWRKTTPGDWKAFKGVSPTDDMRCGVTVAQGKTEYLLATIQNGAPGDFCETEEFNAEFIAHTHADIPALIAEIRRLRSSPDARVSVGDGWKLVPVEPTQEMIIAGLGALVQETERQHANMRPLTKPKHIEGNVYEIPDDEAPQRYMRLGALLRNGKEIKAAFDAILAAAPQPAVALAAMQRLVTVDEWRPIEGAPRDEQILVCGNLKSGGYYREVQKWWKSEHHKDGGFWPVVFMVDHDEPTHWRPLPNPPQAASGNGRA